MSPTSPNATALFIVAAYLSATVVIGYLARRNSATSSEFLHARGNLPTSITALAFLAANCGSLEIIGIAAAAAKYGVLALHFYWIGAIPAMIFVALFMMPIYARSHALTVPEFLRLRYNERTQILNAISLAVMMAFIAGISLYALSSVLHIFFGWSFSHIVFLASIFVLFYVLTGGLKATVYNEVFQLALTIAGLIPLAYFVLRDSHGIRGLATGLPIGMTHLWKKLPLVQPRMATMDIFGVVFGLGFVLSFGYWCTDFLLIQRALAARDIQGSMNTPLIASWVKLLFPILVVVPGIAAASLFHMHGNINYDYALPILMRHYYGPTMLGLGLSAILASLMSGLAGNINAFSTIWTHDLYRAHIRQHESDEHYVLVGRLSILTATLLSVATAYLALRYNNLMDYLQLLFSLFNAPLLATFLLGMFTTWATPTAGFWGLLSGILAAVLHNLAFRTHYLVYGSSMLANFYGAIYGWATCVTSTAVISTFTERKSIEGLAGVTYYTQPKGSKGVPVVSWFIAASVLATCIVLNVVFR